MKAMMITMLALTLVACQQAQTPPQPMTAQERADYEYCRSYAPAEAAAVGYTDGVATCMQWRKAGWGKRGQ